MITSQSNTVIYAPLENKENWFLFVIFSDRLVNQLLEKLLVKTQGLINFHIPGPWMIILQFVHV